MTDDTTPVIYTNAVEIKTTAFDVQLHLYAQVASGPPTDLPAACVVVMSPEHAQALVQALQHTLVEFEANCGPVRQPSKRGWEEER